MKTPITYFTIIALFISLLTSRATAQDESSNKGYRIGTNLFSIPFFQFGFNLEKYNNKNTYVLSLNYRYSDFQNDGPKNYRSLLFNERTYDFDAVSGPIIKLGFARQIGKSGFFMPEIFFKYLGYNEAYFVDNKDNGNYRLQVKSLSSTRYGFAATFGFRNTFFNNENIYYQMNFSLGVQNINDFSTIHQKGFDPGHPIILNPPITYTRNTIAPHINITLIIGIDFSR